MNKTSRITATALLLGSIFITFSGFQAMNAQNYDNVTWPIINIILGILVFVAGALIGSEKITIPEINFLNLQNGQLVMIVFSLPLAVLAASSAGKQANMDNSVVAVLAWSAAMALAIFGGWRAPEGWPRPTWKQGLLLGGIFLVALFPRLIQAETIPVLLTGDEGSSGRAATMYANGELDHLFRTDWYAFPSFYFAIPGLFIRFFGTTVAALRASSAMPGALTVVAAFLVARKAFGERTGWFTAIFLAFLHFHVHFSRIALNNIWDGLWFIVAVGALWYGWRYEHRNAYLLAGLSLGMGQYFYSSGRLIVPVFATWLVFLAIFERERAKKAIPDLLLMLLTALVTVLPLIYFYIQVPEEFAAPMNRVSILGEWLRFNVETRGLPAWQILLEQLWFGFGAFVYVPLRAWYFPEIPILRPIAAVFFMVGLMLMFLRKEKSFPLLLAIWLAGFGFLGALSESTPAAQRYPASAPALAIIVALGLDELSGLFERMWPSAKRLIAVGAFAVMISLAAREAWFYFFEYTPRMVTFMAHENGMIGYRLGLYLRDKPAKNTTVIFIGAPAMGFYSIPSTQYLAPDFFGVDFNYPWGSPDNPPVPEQGDLLFVVLPHLSGELDLVMQEYAGGELHTEYASDSQPLFSVYTFKR
jgi:hypothetical protein